MGINHARERKVFPRRLGIATIYLFLAYWIVTALGILLTIVFAVTLRPFSSAAVPHRRVSTWIRRPPCEPDRADSGRS